MQSYARETNEAMKKNLSPFTKAIFQLPFVIIVVNTVESTAKPVSSEDWLKKRGAAFLFIVKEAFLQKVVTALGDCCHYFGHLGLDSIINTFSQL